MNNSFMQDNTVAGSSRCKACNRKFHAVWKRDKKQFEDLCHVCLNEALYAVVEYEELVDSNYNEIEEAALAKQFTEHWQDLNNEEDSLYEGCFGGSNLVDDYPEY